MHVLLIEFDMLESQTRCTIVYAVSTGSGSLLLRDTGLRTSAATSILDQAIARVVDVRPFAMQPIIVCVISVRDNCPLALNGIYQMTGTWDRRIGQSDFERQGLQGNLISSRRLSYCRTEHANHEAASEHFIISDCATCVCSTIPYAKQIIHLLRIASGFVTFARTSR